MRSFLAGPEIHLPRNGKETPVAWAFELPGHRIIVDGASQMSAPGREGLKISPFLDQIYPFFEIGGSELLIRVKDNLLLPGLFKAHE